MNSEDISGSGRRIGAESGGGWARACDVCRGAPCSVFCRADEAYLCASCDARVHAANRVASRHERVWVCEACERAPATLTCRADNAALCPACDAQVHSANPLARRHQRVPILPIQPGRLILGPDFPQVTDRETNEVTCEDEDEAASWLLPEPAKNNVEFLFDGEVDEYLNFAEYNNTLIGECECVVPVQQQQQQHQAQQQELQEQHQSYQMEMEYEVPKPGFTYTASLSHSVSLSSMEASVVPDTTMTDISNCRIRPAKGTIDLFSGAPIQMAAQFTPMDREARVLRYREKKKARKFEKMIRYASRKAYAETRPRIKGRFAKRSEVKLKVADQTFSASMVSESSYGIVPSF
ncbi:zinc finger protein CONSTANS-LIKE 2 [Dioscorea cayenensis subsp. rotundata]|uniref:Zinc finger protein CONSTANS-LIKE 2 n=1 Tax=Dioscorea cayennensis subsp. rotundata TaxID=55577 RepID=A0AB40D6X8_DIOCR|nr:zinc finger protein CONSTANS-LIKE 2 [Dioscorea cayenensis subsp. rotundata]